MTTINAFYEDLFTEVWTPFMDKLEAMAFAAGLDSGLLLYVYGRESSYGTSQHIGPNGPFQITPIANPLHENVADPEIGAELAVQILLSSQRYWRYAIDAAAKVLASYTAGHGTIVHAARWARTQPEGVTWRAYPGRTLAEGTLMDSARAYLTLDKRTIPYGTTVEVRA